MSSPDETRLRREGVKGYEIESSSSYTYVISLELITPSISTKIVLSSSKVKVVRPKISLNGR